MTPDIRQGATASFAIGDVVCPDATRTLEQVGPELTIRGQITMLSDHGTEKSAFAVIQVEGIHSPLIVPVDRLQLESSKARQPATETESTEARSRQSA
ncbi:MAG: hypothetical protein DHS20C16_33700 [Phycisphaerae bacterium]|nr:MAG: hypothetical protein DHS20C16_33700 [Phycisphaerae bacterium]